MGEESVHPTIEHAAGSILIISKYVMMIETSPIHVHILHEDSRKGKAILPSDLGFKCSSDQAHLSKDPKSLID